ncbi:MAG: prepilin-type N-terminal cleavage/methylation domain-containing protein [Candidatus Pacebacteria bacterium]|nr:prepilin-type N-terminal cleavage/methylation domain-containing protein [Candidatus Paceibacterota bacterium]
MKLMGNRQGFTLIEIMAAISVMAIGVLGVFALSPTIIRGGAANSDRFTASQLALEGLEIVKNIRDSNWLEQNINPANPWNEGLTNCAAGCEADYATMQAFDPVLASYGSGRYLKMNTQGFFNYASGTDTKFKRKITIINGADVMDVSVVVEWSPKYPALVLQEKLYDWR